jgi:NADH-quinone oxidoreductase subunit L
MDTLLRIFPQDNFSLIALILVFPLLGAFINGLFGKRLGKQMVTQIALLAVGVSFIASLVTFFAVTSLEQAEGPAEKVYWDVWHWLTIQFSNPAIGPRNIPIQVAFSIDALSSIMSLVVTGVGFLIHLYSTKYMEDDKSYTRFFTYLNLFIFSMLVLILGDNLPVLFVGWEGVGLCSYLLIGFWFEEEANASAGKKAFIANRIGDFGLLVAMAMLAYYGGALDWSGIDAAAPGLAQEVAIWPIGANAAMGEGTLVVHASTLIALALFLGAAGKSAQIPLYVWLPDAMAGPTPVSALIHAATMVTAGVYLMCRMSTVFVMAPAAMIVVATIGAATAVLAATIAVVQNDIKKVLAYSTVSQLGYMFMATGVGAFSAGFFHVVTHAFFKACLFLGAGSVIYAMHARVHDHDASQDMRNMGGLRKYMPWTHWTFLASCLAIAGLPFVTSGFYSKEAILHAVWSTHDIVGLPSAGMAEVLYVWPHWWSDVLFAVGMFGAVLTAFYMFRLYIGIFWGEFRGWSIVPGFVSKGHDDHGHDDHGHEAGPLEGGEPAESPWPMTLPLVILGALSIVTGFLNAHLFHWHFFDHFVEPVFGEVADAVIPDAQADAMQGGVLILGSSTFAIGVSVAFWFYFFGKGAVPRKLRSAMPGLHRLVYDKWRVDELYEATILGAVDALAIFFAWFDKWIVDGIVAKLPAGIVQGLGTGFRQLQTGRIQAYAAFMVLGLAGIGWYFIAPDAEAELTENHREGLYSLQAGSGVGFGYRWDQDGDGQMDTDEFSAERGIEIRLEPGERRTILLEVRDAFGGTDVEEIEVFRPQGFGAPAIGSLGTVGPLGAVGTVGGQQ